MKLSSFVGAAVLAVATFIGTQGCSGSNDATSASGIKCTPGNFVFCRCADRSEGTKLCKEDGASFETCTTGAAGQCAGGEEDLTDPKTGQEVPPPSGPPTEAGPPGSPVDACPGKATALTPGAEVIVDGDTTGAKDDTEGKVGACAAGGGGPDHVYRLQPTGSGSLSIKVDGEGGMNPLFYLRSTCADKESQALCAPPLGAGSLVQASMNVQTGRDYFLVVDGASASAGKYRLTMKLTTGAFCGDGKVDAGEACDDGNKVENDGCSNSCQQVNGDPASGTSCPGQPVHIWPGKVVTGTGSTTAVGYGSTFSKTSTTCDLSTNTFLAPDHVYEVTAHAAGTLKVTLTPIENTFNVQLVARTICTDPNSQGPISAGRCANLGSAGAAEVMSFKVTNGEKVSVAADGVLASSSKGSYTIKYELLP